MAIDTLDKLIEAKSTNIYYEVSYSSITSVANFTYLLNKTNGVGYAGITSCRDFNTLAPFSTGGKIPHCLTNNNGGAPAIINASSGKSNYLNSVSFRNSTTTATTLKLYDLLWYATGFAGNTTSNQIVSGAPAITRNTTGENNEIYVYAHTIMGSTQADLYINYTNSDGVTNRTAYAVIPASMPINRLVKMRLQAGDKGVRSIQYVQFGNSTGTAGNMGVLLVNPLTIMMTYDTGTPCSLSSFDTDLKLIEPGCFIIPVGITTGTSSGYTKITLSIMESA